MRQARTHYSDTERDGTRTGAAKRKAREARQLGRLKRMRWHAAQASTRRSLAALAS